MHLVYALTDGMAVRYVGYTARPEGRHRKHASRHPNWRWLVLGAYPTRESGLEHERWWIKRLSNIGHSLTNKNDGGGASLIGRTVSELTRARMRKPKSDAHKTKLSAALLGRKLSPQHCARIAEGHKGKPAVWNSHPLSSSHREALRMAHVGRRHSAETRAKISLAKMGNKSRLGLAHTAETKEKIRISNLGKNSGRRHTEATRAKIAASQRGKRHTETTRTAMSAAQIERRRREHANQN